MKIKRILKIFYLIILLVSFVVVMNTGLTWSYFSDSVEVGGNSFQAGSWVSSP